MMESTNNKMMNSKDAKNKDIPENPELESFFFPEHGVTVSATSIEEATKKVEKIINKKEE